MFQALYDGVRELLVGKWATTFFVCNFMIYPSLARVAFGLQKCIELDDGQRRPYSDLDISCLSKDYAMWAGLTGFLAVGYLVGYPLVRRVKASCPGGVSLERFLQGLVYLLRENKPYFGEKFIHGRYMWLYTGVKDQLYWWDVVVMARKVWAAQESFKLSPPHVVCRPGVHCFDSRLRGAHRELVVRLDSGNWHSNHIPHGASARPAVHSSCRQSRGGEFTRCDGVNMGHWVALLQRRANKRSMEVGSCHRAHSLCQHHVCSSGVYVDR